ncbi:FAD binding domain-containing protein [Arthrobacter sp. Sa2BUA2]|uniref:FAD binding domain-containing protein n=1 Tax=Arthrobacter pullicola TaxID=2762224 RepID=A0ABR8YEE3_9MICC|nr:FAD binding domain-containing protein [Arthrobacter pullicola]MBD8042575.1 FAD binding domain-containing protein [Arthrobacter pullicola]
MDINTITDLVPTSDPAHWRPGDAWLGGGTVLFSYGSQSLQRLLDITRAGWKPLSATDGGLEIAATCTVAELYAFAGDLPAAAADWTALELLRPCCDAFVASFKIWNVSTVGGNLCTALPAGPMTSLTAALDGRALVLSPDGTQRTLPVTELVTGDGQTSLAPGELLRSVSLPAHALRARTAMRRLSLSNLGRSGVLVIGRVDPGGDFILTVTASTVRPVQLRFGSVPGPGELRGALDAAIPFALYHDDVHGLPQWRQYMTERLSEEIRAELAEASQEMKAAQ